MLHAAAGTGIKTPRWGQVFRVGNFGRKKKPRFLGRGLWLLDQGLSILQVLDHLRGAEGDRFCFLDLLDPVGQVFLQSGRKVGNLASPTLIIRHLLLLLGFADMLRDTGQARARLLDDPATGDLLFITQRRGGR